MDEKRKVVGLFGDHVMLPGEVSADLVEYLEELLESARSGEAVGCVCIEMLKDDTTSWAIHGHIVHRTMIGAMEYAKHYLLTK